MWDVPWTDVPWTMYWICALARGVAKQEQGEFLKRRGLGRGKVLGKMDHVRCTMYHVLDLRAGARSCEAKARRISEATRFGERKGFEKMDRCTMDHVGNLASSAREVAKREQGEFLKRCAFCVRKGFQYMVQGQTHWKCVCPCRFLRIRASPQRQAPRFR